MSKSSTYAPVGSQYEKLYPRELPRRRRRKVKRFINNRLELLGCFLVPFIYGLYIRLVWLSSRTSNHNDALQPLIKRRTGLITMLWHQEVATSPYVFRGNDVHTLASTNTLGRLVTAVLESNQYKVFRGGRRHKIILKDMIRHLDENPEVKYGITVDGSTGPARVMKRGACMMARETGTALFVTTTRMRHCIFAKTWDQTVMPLPFNRIETQTIGPYWIDPSCSDEVFERFCEHMQNELLSLTDYCDRRVKNGKIDARVRKDFPENWDAARWGPGSVGLPFGEWDLQTEKFPPWSRTAKSE